MLPDQQNDSQTWELFMDPDRPDTKKSVHRIDYDADTEVRLVVYHQNNPADEHYYFAVYACNSTVGLKGWIRQPADQPGGPEYRTRGAAKTAAVAWYRRHPEKVAALVATTRNTAAETAIQP